MARARGETVLVVEDDDAVRRAIAGQLMRLGYRVLVAANAGEALLVCERHPGPIDLLLADVELPIVDGRELAGRLARVRARMRVVFMSGHAGDADALCKPLRPDQLARRLRVELD
jgi:CheY-like chemotaxis protein